MAFQTIAFIFFNKKVQNDLKLFSEHIRIVYKSKEHIKNRLQRFHEDFMFNSRSLSVIGSSTLYNLLLEGPFERDFWKMKLL